MAEVTIEPILERLVEFHWAGNRGRAFQASAQPEQKCRSWRAWAEAEGQDLALGTPDAAHRTSCGCHTRERAI